MRKKLLSRVLFGILLCMCMLFAHKETAEASIYLDMDNTTITEENAVVSAMVSTGMQPMDSITIVIKKNGEEIKRLKKNVSTHESGLYTFDFQKDLDITLEKDCLYEYIISQQRPFSVEDEAFGQFYTGEDTYVIIYTTMLDRSARTEYIISVECILGVSPKESFYYEAERKHPTHKNLLKYDQDSVFVEELPCEYVISEISEDPSENIIKNQYYYSVLPTGVYKIGGYYIKDSDTKERVGVGYFMTPSIIEEVYIPKDVIEINGQYYMYDATLTTQELYVSAYRPFYQNVYDIFYKKCDAPTTQTSANVKFINVDTGEQIQHKTVSDLVVGEGFSYVPENAYMDEKYNYVYVAEAAGTVLTLEKLWTNPENNVLTVYYKAVSANADITANDTTASKEQQQNITNPIKKAKPAIKKISRKNKTAIKLTFGKIKKAQGYEICYSTKKSFKKPVTKRVKKTTVTLKNLKKKKTYYIKVRGYKIMDGKIYYSKYSKVKRI